MKAGSSCSCWERLISQQSELRGFSVLLHRLCGLGVPVASLGSPVHQGIRNDFWYRACTWRDYRQFRVPQRSSFCAWADLKFSSFWEFLAQYWVCRSWARLKCSLTNHRLVELLFEAIHTKFHLWDGRRWSHSAISLLRPWFETYQLHHQNRVESHISAFLRLAFTLRI